MDFMELCQKSCIVDKIVLGTGHTGFSKRFLIGGNGFLRSPNILNSSFLAAIGLVF